MADKVVSVDIRLAVVNWPPDVPRGAVTRFCKDHAVSRSWFYEVRRRAVTEPFVEALQPRVRTPSARHSQAVAVDVEELAVAIRKELADQGLDHGPVTVRYHIEKLGVPAPAASTLARIFTKRGMVRPQPQKRPRSSYRRFEFAMVHECWQLDSFEWHLATSQKCVIFQLLDDCSRQILVSRVAHGETAADAIVVVDDAIAAHQVPCLLLTDNGTAFNATRRGWTSQLVTHLTAMGCKPITGKPGHPQTQGKDERVHQTLQNWLRAHPAADTIDELQIVVDGFDVYYNTERPHQSLDMLTPAQARATRPVAVPPQPPGPAPAGTAGPGPRVGTRRVAPNGTIGVDDALVQVGHELVGSQVTVLISPNRHVSVFSATGDLIRALILEPGRRYHGNGKLPRRSPTPGRPGSNRPD